MLGRLTAEARIRGIVASDVVRRLVSRTITQQLSDVAFAAPSPFQHALSTRCECISHALQSLSELDPNATILSIDGIGAFDLVSRGAMLQGLANVCLSALPFVHQFFGSPSHYIWEDDAGVVHNIAQGEGGEQGDPMMPLLFSLGQQAALMAVQRQLEAHERVFAFLDDVHIVTSPYSQAKLWRHSRIDVHDGKTQVWNASGLRPEGCDILDRAGRAVNPKFDSVWRGDGTTNTQGIKVLGTHLGHENFGRDHLRRTMEDHMSLLEKIPSLPDVQSAWALLLHCASARANYMLRAIRPELIVQFSVDHNAGLWSCLCNILRIAPDQCDELRMLDFGQFDFGKFDFGQLAEVEIGRSRNWPKSKLAELEIGRSRNWPKSKLAEVEIGRSRSRSMS